MKTILIPTDFSNHAYHAARYACMLSEQLSLTQIILYHACEPVMVPVSHTSAFIDDDPVIKRNSSLEQLEIFHNRLHSFLPSSPAVKYRTENAGLTESINTIIEEENPDLIVMGTPGKGGLEHLLFGSHTLRTLEKSTRPVLIVPPVALPQPVKNIILCIDLKDAAGIYPLAELGKILYDLNAQVYVLYVSHDKESVPADAAIHSSQMHELLKNFNPVYKHISNKKIVNGITSFASAYQAPLIITINKKHGFISRLLKRSVTHRLLSESAIPLMILHEKE